MSLQRSEIINWVAFGGGVYLLSERGMSTEAIFGVVLIAYGIGEVRSLVNRILP